MTYQERRLRRDHGADAAVHRADAYERVTRIRGEQLDGVDVDRAEDHADQHLAAQRQHHCYRCWNVISFSWNLSLYCSTMKACAIINIFTFKFMELVSIIILP